MTIEELKKAVARLRKGSVRPKFPHDLKLVTIGLMEEWAANGGEVRDFSKEVDIPTKTLHTWHRAVPRRKSRVRPVQVSNPEIARREISIVLPGGVRIEGVSAKEAIEIAKVLS